MGVRARYPSHHGLGLAASALAAHAGAAIVLAVLVTWLEARLERAVTLVRRLRRWLADGAAAPAPGRTPSARHVPVSRRPVGRLTCRGPPVLRSA